MKIALIHNAYGKYSGEEAVVDSNERFLREAGVDIVRYSRTSADLHGFIGAVKGFFCGIWNPVSVKKFSDFLSIEKPDVVHVHNLYPLINPQIIHTCKKKNIPVVMTVHNYRLICPNGLCLRHGKICHLCFETKKKELACLLHNCENNLFKSLGYFLRNLNSRLMGYYKEVDHFIILSNFQKNLLCSNGFLSERMTVLGNCLPSIKDEIVHDQNYILYIGRISKEKGIEIVLQAATYLPNQKFIIAGNGDVSLLQNLPANVTYFGFASGREKENLEKNASLIIIPSQCYEGFPIVILEALQYRKAVIVSDLGAMKEIAGEAALTFQHENSASLAEQINSLLKNPEQKRKMGEAGRKRFESLYSDEIYTRNLIQVYQKQICKYK